MGEQGKDDQGEERRPVLTNRQGHPVYDNQNNRTVGDRGPTVLENNQFLEKISHFDRERIPERVVHARGAGAHGYFEAYGSIGDDPSSKYTRAKLFQEKGKRSPVFVRFSTVIHDGQGSHAVRLRQRRARRSAVRTTMAKPVRATARWRTGNATS